MSSNNGSTGGQNPGAAPSIPPAPPTGSAGAAPIRYLRYDELVAFLKAQAEAHPQLCKLDVIGTSREGRAIYAVTLTNQATGPDRDKPGYLVDANTHAGEVTGSAAVVWIIGYLLAQYGKDPDVTELLDTRAFYAVPRLTVDGSEFYLTTPYSTRSSARLYPHPEERPGLVPEDVNGDGKILRMRVVDPHGDWKQDSRDPRLMVRRAPDDQNGGPYYKVYTEGVVLAETRTTGTLAPDAWDHREIQYAPTRWGLDFNRNYPAHWNPEGAQPGAGPYPLSEPEPRALATFLLDHPNIGGYVAYHTTGGVLLRPPSMGGDDKIPEADVRLFKRLGETCTRTTGYSCKSTYEAFGYEGQTALVKGADDWAYEHLGVMAYCMELWDRHTRAGARAYGRVGVKALLKLTPEEEAEDELKLLQWIDRELNGEGFTPWTPFTHPQLGEVEIGGWDPKYVVQNPPLKLLEEEVSKAGLFTIQHALSLPRLAVEARAEQLAEGVWKVSACVRNLGALPTNVTEMAIQAKQAKPVKVEISQKPAAGKQVQEIGHLGGWGLSNERWVDWVVTGQPGDRVEMIAHSPRAGRITAHVRLRAKPE